MWSLIRPVLLRDEIFEKKIRLVGDTIQKKTFGVFIALFTFLSSIRGFPNASKGWKIKLTRT